MKKTLWAILLILPLMVACQREEAAEVTSGEETPAPLVQAKNGKLYAIACIQDLGFDRMNECEFRPPTSNSKGARGHHNYSNWWSNYWTYYWGYYNNYYSTWGSYPYYSLSFYTPTTFCSSFFGFGDCYGNFGYNYYTNFGFDRCDRCINAPNPARCQRRNQCNGASGFTFNEGCQQGAYSC